MRRVIQLFLSCGVLGIGVGLLLAADLGSDGYSTLINGATRASGLPFALVNISIGLILVLLAWLKGARPALGTVVQPVVTGLVVGYVLDLVPAGLSLPARIGLLVTAFVILSVGVAGYLGSRFGAGPAEALSTAWDPPVPFRWSYSAFQFAGAVAGWLLGASIGVATVLVIVLLGPAVDLLGRRFATLSPHARPA